MLRKFTTFFALAALLIACGEDSKDAGSFKGVPLSNLRSGVATVGTGEIKHASCPEVTNCLFTCGTDACVEACAQRSDPTAFEYSSDLVLCIADECGEDDASCIDENCGELDQRCADYEAESSGGSEIPTDRPDNCGELLTCLNECDNDACLMSCVDSGSAAANQKLEAILTCDRQCQDSGGSNCLETACSTEVQACAEDRYAP